MSDKTVIDHKVFSGKATRMIILIVLACCITAAVIYKGATASMTHDESSTYLNLVDGSALNLWSCYSNPECWTTANNHLLNTLLMRWSVSVFGPTEFSLRLPNLLLLLVYVGCVICLLGESARNVAMRICGLGLLLCNPFVLDFFALARGYGMGLGFMLLSMFAVWRYFLRGKPGYCLLACGAATAAVFANLTYVAYVAALTGALSLSVVAMMIRRPRRQISGLIPLSVAACLIFLAIYFYRPVLILIGLGEFEYGASSLWDSWKGFARDSLYGIQWFGEKTIDILSVSSALIVGLGMGVAWLPMREAENKTAVHFGRFVSLLCIILIVFFVASHLWTGSYYPTGRKSIIYFPCCALMVYLMVYRFAGSRWWSQLLIFTGGLLLLVHFAYAFNARVFREWWYDASTKEMATYVAEKAHDSSTVPLGVEWIFHPSTQYYVQTKQLPIDLAPYSKEITPTDSVDYYYVHPEHVPKLESDFEIEKDFNGRLLLRTKR